MFEKPGEIEKIISRSDAVLQILDRRSNVKFSMGIVRCKVAALGYEYVWGDMSMEILTNKLVEMGFDNLTLVTIADCIAHLKRKVFETKTIPPKASFRSRLTKEQKLALWEEQIKRKVRQGKF